MSNHHTSPERKDALDSLFFDITHDIINLQGGYFLVRYISLDGEIHEDFIIGPIESYKNLFSFLLSDKAPFDIDSENSGMRILNIEALHITDLIPNMLERNQTGSLHKVSFSVDQYDEDIYYPNHGHPHVYPVGKSSYHKKESLLVMNALGFDDAVDLASLYLSYKYETHPNICVKIEDSIEEVKTRYKISFDSVEEIRGVKLYPTVDFYNLTKNFPQ